MFLASLHIIEYALWREDGGKMEQHGIPIMMTVEEFGKLLRISRNTAYECVRSGEVPSVRVGRQIRIFRDDVFALRRFVKETEVSHPTNL